MLYNVCVVHFENNKSILKMIVKKMIRAKVMQISFITYYFQLHYILGLTFPTWNS